MTAWPGERRTAAGALSRVTNSAGVTQQGALTCPPALMCCSPIWPLPATARRQVSGRDISKARHEDAVEAFRTAKEPIVVEVLRRDSSSLTSNGTLPGNQKPDDNKKMTTDDNCEAPSRGNSNRAKTAAAPSNATSPTLCDTSTQTEWTGGWGESPLVTFPQNGTGYLQSSPLRTVPLLTGEVITNFQPLNGAEVEDDDVGCEVEYEEVTLRRSSSSEKLGLTLCYGAPDDSDTDIYVSEVEPLSVAGKDGRIIEGDQLLQINGVEVRNREQAVSLFSEKRSDVTLLVARPQQGVAEDDDDDDDASDLCRSHNALIEEDELEDELEEVAGQHEKDSGVGRTDESTRNDESSEENLDHLDAVVAGTGSDALDAACTSGMTTGNDVTVSASDCERFREQLELKCASTSTTNLDMILKKPGPSSNQPKTNAPTPPIGRYQSDASLDREMALLNQEMEHIQLECESLVHRHMSESQKKATTSSPSSSCHTRVSGGSDSVAGDQLYVNLVDLQNQIRGRTSSASVASRIPSSSHPAAVSTEDVSTESNKPLSIRSRIQAMSKKEAVERWVKSMVFGRGRHGSVSSPSRQHQNHSEQERDSAYNTGGSTPLTLELSPLVLNPGQTGDKRSNVVSHHGSMMSLVSPRMEDKGTQLQESDVASIFSCDSCRRCCRALLQQQQSENFYQDSIRRRLSPDLTRNHGSNMHQASNRRHRAASDEGSSRGSALGSKDDLHYSEKNKNYVTFHPCATMYTNQANLQHTIWLQQQLFRDALQARETPQPGINITKKPPVIPTNGCRRSGSAGGASSGMVVLASPTTQSLVRSGLTSCPSSPSKGNTPVMEEVKMEWKVKRRADGTRYIARRPARNKILKERALKINEERTGLTTDDDAMSELKVGRYWSKEERKRHLERARDRKRKEMQLRTNRMTSVGTGSNQEHQNGDERVDDLVAVNNRPFTILELSQKKMLKKKGRAVFDDFTTVQEVLAHGNKVQGSKTLGLLSVTTV